jgi:hypothetical protein
MRGVRAHRAGTVRKSISALAGLRPIELRIKNRTMPRMAKTMVSQDSQTAPTHEEIAAQAYQIYLREGSPSGRDLEHWLRAEEELRANGNGKSERRGQAAEANGKGGATGGGNGASRSFVEAPWSAVMTAAAAPGPTPAASRGSAPRKSLATAKR